jgi:hypothetical protein
MEVTKILVSSENETIWTDSPIEIEGISQSLRGILDAKFLSDLEGEGFPKVAEFYSPFDELEAARQIEDLILTRVLSGK